MAMRIAEFGVAVAGDGRSVVVWYYLPNGADPQQILAWVWDQAGAPRVPESVGYYSATN